LAVERGGAVLAEGAEVDRGAVAFVGGKAVVGVPVVEARDEGVAVNLGEDAGGGDGERERIAVDEASLRAGMVETHCVDEKVIGRDGELADGGEHGKAGGLVDVDAVDGGGVYFGNREADGKRADDGDEALAVLGCELLGVGKAGFGEGCEGFWQDDRGGDDGTEESATSDLVDTGDEGVAATSEGLLGGVGADELTEHPLLEGGWGELSGVRCAHSVSLQGDGSGGCKAYTDETDARRIFESCKFGSRKL
jgi:hypothetical protein